MTAPLLDLDGRVVGRRQELAELRAAVDEAGRAGGGCTLLSGISGVGKSTLTQAFGQVSGRNCVFAYGRYQDGAAAPYSALGAALGSIVRSMEATGTAERDRWRADLVSEMSALPASSRRWCPTWRECLARPRRWLTSMRRMLDADCSALSSACCPLRVLPNGGPGNR